MRRRQKNHKRVGSMYVVEIHVPLYAKKFNFFRLMKDKFPNFLHELAY